MRRLLFSLSCIIAVLTLLASPSADAGAMQKINVTWVTVTGTAQNVQALIGSSSATECSIKIGNLSTTKVCVGGDNVNMTVTDGGHCWPVCTDATNCMEAVTSGMWTAGATWVKVASGTQVIAVMTGGNCK